MKEINRAVVSKGKEQAYLLRCWQEAGYEQEQANSWRFSVEEIFRHNRRHGFATWPEVIAFLEAHIDEGGLNHER